MLDSLGLDMPVVAQYLVKEEDVRWLVWMAEKYSMCSVRCLDNLRMWCWHYGRSAWDIQQHCTVEQHGPFDLPASKQSVAYDDFVGIQCQAFVLVTVLQDWLVMSPVNAAVFVSLLRFEIYEVVVVAAAVVIVVQQHVRQL